MESGSLNRKETSVEMYFSLNWQNAHFSRKSISHWVFEVTTTMLPFGIRQLARLLVRPIVNHFLGDLGDIFQIMEERLSEEEKPWLAGSRMGLADFNMSFGIDMASARGYFDGEKYPKVQAWLEKIHAREAYKALDEGDGYDLVNFT